jgi:tetratricopeptide (TPR) repeat protein
MSEQRYKAFISYSHQDDKVAAWLHRALETYKPPKNLIGQQAKHGAVPKRLAPIFRDRDELASAHHLGTVINEALSQSACQIVICSPAAARSKWVNEEILAYKRLGREDRILCLIVGGEPNATDLPGRADEECFPPALRYRLGADGKLSDERTEPIAADARENKDGKANAKIKLIAGILGVGFDDLRQRELHRRHRRMAAIVAASVAGMFVATGLAVAALLARSEAIEQRARAEAEAETAKQTTNFMVDLFRVSDPSEALGNTITAREILDKGAARIDEQLASQPTIQATLMETIGTVYTSLGLYEPAVALLESALEKRRDLFGDDDLEVARSRDRLGEVLKLKAEYAQAEKMYREALATRIELLGEDHLDVARSEFELADLLERMGSFEEAEQRFRHALELRLRLLGVDSIEVAQSMEGLALNLYDQADYAGSAQLQREAVALQRKLHSGPHPDLAEAISNLGFVLLELGEYGESETLFRESLSMKRILLGEAHPEIALGLNNVAFALHDQGKYKEAAAMYREAIEMQRELLGEIHPEVALSLNNLAFLLYDEGDMENALAMSRESLDIYRKALGEEHPSVARGMANLGMWLTENEDYAAAEPLTRESLDLRKKLLGEDHPDVAGSETVLANLLIATKRYEEAYGLAANAKEIYAKTLSPKHWRTANAMSAEGAALTGMQRFEDAEPLLLDALAILDEDAGALRVVLTNTKRRLADLYAASGRTTEAAKYVAMLEDNSSGKP